MLGSGAARAVILSSGLVSQEDGGLPPFGGPSSRLDVWSRDLVVRVVREPERLVRPGFADGLVGCQAT